MDPLSELCLRRGGVGEPRVPAVPKRPDRHARRRGLDLPRGQPAQVPLVVRVEGLRVVVGVHDPRVGQRGPERLELGGDGLARQGPLRALPGDAGLLGGVL